MSRGPLHIQDLVFGDDGEQPMRTPITSFMTQAKEDGVRLRVEVRSQLRGTPRSQQERVLTLDPNKFTVDEVMQSIDEALKSSPGEEFTGEIRINFSQAGSSSNRYGSFTRQVQAAYIPHHPGSMGLNPAMYDPEMEYDGDNGPGDLQGPPGPLGGMNLGMGMGMGAPPGGVVPVETALQWAETGLNMAFRAMAQQQQMFDRAMGMVESLHFGFTRAPSDPGIVEQRPAEGTPNLLGTLLNAATQLARADNAGEAVATAAELASGAIQPDSTAAIQAAGNQVKRLAVGGGPGRHGGGNHPPDDYDPEDEDEDLGFEDESFAADPDDFPIDDDDDFIDDDDYDEPDIPEPDFAAMDEHEVKDAFLKWIRADPKRKQKVMDMVPELMNEVTS